VWKVPLPPAARPSADGASAAAPEAALEAASTAAPTLEWGEGQLLVGEDAPPLPTWAATDPAPGAGAADSKALLGKKKVG
jgi:hypothetical protein